MKSKLLCCAFAVQALCFGPAALVASAQVVPYGSGINPPGSLTLTAGSPEIGADFRLTVRNTALPFPPTGQAFLFLASQPALGFPSGQLLPGLNLGFPGRQGELLIDVAAPNPLLTLGPTPYSGGPSSGANFDISVPFQVTLVGLELFAQGLLVTPGPAVKSGLTNGLKLKLEAPNFPGLTLIEPGTFKMGSDGADGAPYFVSTREKPVHAVTITKPFWMGRHEVTQAEYQALMGTNPSFSLGADQPVETVSWVAALAYCSALNAQQSALGKVPVGYQYRLPTEAEWEYACRAGTTTEFNLGSELFCNQAKFFYSEHSASLCNSTGPVPVGSYAPNAWGLFDMHGNVWEWCLDSYADYTAAPVSDPYVSVGPFKVFRGGSFEFNSGSCRSATRSFVAPDTGFISIGFRVVLAPVLVP